VYDDPCKIEALEQTIASRRQIIDEAASSARTQLEIANSSVETAQQNLTTAITNHAEHTGGLAGLRKRRDAEDLSVAELRLQTSKSHHDALPIADSARIDFLRFVSKDTCWTLFGVEAGMHLWVEHEDG
jgi:hypothetical protein